MSGPRQVKSLSAGDMEKLPTPRLLAYRKKLLALEDSIARSDWEPDQTESLKDGFVSFRESPEWQETAAAAKAILDERDHIQR